jgi:hypothetical protein
MFPVCPPSSHTSKALFVAQRDERIDGGARRAGNRQAAIPAFTTTLTAAENVHGSVVETLEIWHARTGERCAEATQRYELVFDADLFPAFLRGQAYLALRKPNEAIEFQKLVDLTTASSFRLPAGRWYWGQLGRAQTMVGTRLRRRRHIRAFCVVEGCRCRPTRPEAGQG